MIVPDLVKAVTDGQKKARVENQGDCFMNERIRELAKQAGFQYIKDEGIGWAGNHNASLPKFAELIVKEMCGLLEQAEDDVYHCFEPSERPTEYIEWLRDWQERFEKHFGVEE